MSTNTKKQHYVWEYYLQAWATGRQIWCRYNNGKPFKTSTENVAQERYFYEISKPTQEEITLIERILGRGNLLTRMTDLQTFHTYLQVAFSEEKIRRLGIGGSMELLKTKHSQS